MWFFDGSIRGLQFVFFGEICDWDLHWRKNLRRFPLRDFENDTSRRCQQNQTWPNDSYWILGFFEGISQCCRYPWSRHLGLRNSTVQDQLRNNGLSTRWTFFSIFSMILSKFLSINSRILIKWLSHVAYFYLVGFSPHQQKVATGNGRSQTAKHITSGWTESWGAFLTLLGGSSHLVSG